MTEIEGLTDEGWKNSCSICLEIVVDGGDRSTARLQCGHDFHLDCIGSAFNAKGVMQCPNCRKVEKGNWLYSHGLRSSPELSFEWTYDEDLYDLYSGMTFGVHWCPFSRLASLPSSFESASRLAGSYVSSLTAPPFLPTSQPHGHVHDHRYPHNNPPNLHGSVFSSSHQSGPAPSLPPVGPAPSSLPDPTTYYLFPPAPSSSRSTHRDVEGTRDYFYSWESDRFSPFPLLPVPPPHSTRGSSRRRAEGSSAYRPPHAGSRTRHYN